MGFDVFARSINQRYAPPGCDSSADANCLSRIQAIVVGYIVIYLTEMRDVPASEVFLNPVVSLHDVSAPFFVFWKRRFIGISE